MQITCITPPSQKYCSHQDALSVGSARSSSPSRKSLWKNLTLQAEKKLFPLEFFIFTGKKISMKVVDEPSSFG